ncbi:helix-turn-helix domain-containing protein [Streptomyces natalensis]|uniref:helix-turn-helix domain-containing protein n=1 Tax=Streptomyces natalensis TaxID=68242 RepID=UPI0006896B1A|nr:transposase family protein [Streptomyces natalensis]
MIEELAPCWEARCGSALHERRQGARRRQAGAGPKYELVFTDRLLATLVRLRTGLSHEALGVIYEVGSSTIGRAISEIRPLLAERGCAVPDRLGLRLRTLEDVFAYAAAENITLRIDGTESQVRRPGANRRGRRAFVSGKRRRHRRRGNDPADGGSFPEQGAAAESWRMQLLCTVTHRYRRRRRTWRSTPRTSAPPQRIPVSDPAEGAYPIRNAKTAPYSPARPPRTTSTT